MNIFLKFSKIIIVPALIIVLVYSGFIYYKSKTKPTFEKSEENKGIVSQTPTEEEKQAGYSDLFTGKLKKLNQDLGVVIATEDEKLNDFIPKIKYYEAGTYLKGKYKGYTRYIAIKEAWGPGGPKSFVLASKDQKEYILDKTPLDEELYVNEDPLYDLDKNKVTKIDYLDTEHSYEIALNDVFGLSRDSLPVESNKISDTEYEDTLITDFSKYKKLDLKNSKFTLYQETFTPEDVNKSYANHIEGTTKVYVVDSTGLAYYYNLSTPQVIKDYPKLRDEYKIADAKWSKDPQNNPMPETLTKPNLKITKNDLQTQRDHFNEYDKALPQTCAIDVNTFLVKNITSTDLEGFGFSKFGEVFMLKNKKHPLFKIQYDTKFSEGQGYYKDYKEAKAPTLEEYINQTPLVFFKDYWGRWVMLGEYDYYTPGGCGKPVVYLYPTTPTKVNVQITTPIRFETTIPNYQNGWTVMAYPDGNLVDLHPEATNCKDIDVTKKGSEYAYDACRNNSYPYLYWTGTSTEKSYPRINGGWIVERNNLKQFMSSKLDEIGFNANEKRDMLEYWLPHMERKNAPYYRISFLQTSEMNSIAPMRITPAPKSTYRLFLDYLPLSEMPVNKPEPQKLAKVVRNGFTVVEWGGLKR